MSSGRASETTLWADSGASTSDVYRLEPIVVTAPREPDAGRYATAAVMLVAASAATETGAKLVEYGNLAVRGLGHMPAGRGVGHFLRIVGFSMEGVGLGLIYVAGQVVAPPQTAPPTMTPPPSVEVEGAMVAP
jgi:hypothetical protein